MQFRCVTEAEFLQICPWNSHCKPQNMRLCSRGGLQVPETSTWPPSLSQQSGEMTQEAWEGTSFTLVSQRGGRALVSCRIQSPARGTWGHRGIKAVSSHSKSQPEERGQGKAGELRLHHRRSPASWVTVPQFPHMEMMLLPHRPLAKRSETDFHKGSFPGSWSRGTHGFLIIHPDLRQESKIAPVTHCAKKAKGFQTVPRGQLHVFLGIGRW